MKAGRIFVVVFVTLFGGFIGLVSACKSDPAPTFLQAQDLSTADAGFLMSAFDKNTIIDSASFTDSTTIQSSDIQGFFTKTPYSRSSFLETYQSNGIRASDAIANAAQNHGINPLVFLALLETTQGLLGSRNYVFPPERVEYVFDCGCEESTNCIPAYAGLDRQLDCLGRKLRASFDAANATGGTTDSGWGTGVTMNTVDGVPVSPANAATAALYDWNPKVALDQPGGQWVFWNVYQLYANNLNYIGPLGTNGGKWIGDPCNGDNECQTVQGAICDTNYPNGMCVVECSPSVSCPSGEGRADSFCAAFSDGFFCFPTCNPQAQACRDGGQCLHVDGANGDKGYICTQSSN